MPTMKLSDVRPAAALLKKLVKAADSNGDGALRSAEILNVGPKSQRALTRFEYLPRAALQGVQRFAMSKGSVTVSSIQKAVETVARRLRPRDKDGDGLLSEAEWKKLPTNAERSFVSFGAVYAHDTLADFSVPVQQQTVLPPFKWSGTVAEVCTSLLNACSDRSNDNYWPEWASPGKGPSRYVLGQGESRRMVAALRPLYPSRQKAVLGELAHRTGTSVFGCVSVSKAAAAVFEEYAAELGLTGLAFGAPAAPRLPPS